MEKATTPGEVSKSIWQRLRHCSRHAAGGGAPRGLQGREAPFESLYTERTSGGSAIDFKLGRFVASSIAHVKRT